MNKNTQRNPKNEDYNDFVEGGKISWVCKASQTLQNRVGRGRMGKENTRSMRNVMNIPGKVKDQVAREDFEDWRERRGDRT